MQRCYLVVNKDTQVAAYLTNRSIVSITEERRSLAELDIRAMPIVDVEKMVIIHYETDDGGLSFRADMNALRNLLGSAFFHADDLTVILVNFADPLAEDLVYSATRDSSLTRDKITIIHHTGTLMLADVGKYLAGSAIGQNTSSTYKSVFVREADKEEKDRFENLVGDDGLDKILPVLTDMSALYKQRSHVEAISAGHVVTESAVRPEVVTDFTNVDVQNLKVMPVFVVSGDQWTSSERAVRYLVDYARVIGRRVLVVNTDSRVDMEQALGSCTTLVVQGLRVSSTPASPVALLNARFNQIGYIAQFLGNILGIEEVLFNVSKEDYKQMCHFAGQMSEEVHRVFISHFNEDSIKLFLSEGTPADSLFLTFELFSSEFDLGKYKKDFKGIVVAKFPVEDVDVIEFRDLSTGAKGDEGGEENE